MTLSPDTHPSLPGLELLAKAFPDRIAAGGIPVVFVSGRKDPGFTISRQTPHGFRVEFAQPCDAYRALGLLLAGQSPETQNRAHESVGVMWDLSRNAILKRAAWEELFGKFALLGINMVQLYMEDVYEIPGEPFFGYGRGAYTQDELRRIDHLGRQFGMEVIPCIQTLGHLSQIHQWPAYADTVDLKGVLLAGSDTTRALIGKMLDTVAACFQSRQIHIGMDEAVGVGTGNYLKKNGYERAFDVLNRHLQMVVAMCRERGLSPMMWSDMYFRIGSAKSEYYDTKSVIPPEVAAGIPPEVELVYWDYYHTDSAFYVEWIRRHRALGKEPVFAAGGWNWSRFWAFAPQWRKSLAAGMKAAREEKLSRVMLTLWGDDGNECHPASVLPAIQHFAEWAYVDEPVADVLEKQFSILASGAPLSLYLRASDLDEVPAMRGAAHSGSNTSKWILWSDPILGTLDAHLTDDLPSHYRALAESLNQPTADQPVRFAATTARAVAAKAELHLKARTAWKAGDHKELLRLKNEVLPECRQAIREMWQAHRTFWRQWHKPFGWEVIERRYAGLIARLESLDELLGDILRNPQLPVPEWEFQPLRLHDLPNYNNFPYHTAATPSAVK